MAYINGNTKRQGFSPNAKGISLNSARGSRIGFSVDSTPRDKSLCVFG
jgi:hypothetical protein